MYSEQLAVFLLIAANGLAGQANLNSGPAATMPYGRGDQNSVNLKLDPRLHSYRNPYTRKIVQRKMATQPALLARVD
jgi:hypothetical protein